jgi:hypothetical protein
MFVQIFNPSAFGAVDAYSEHHPNWYWNGAGTGLVIGLVLAVWTLLVLKRHEEEEAAGDSEAQAAH